MKNRSSNDDLFFILHFQQKQMPKVHALQPFFFQLVELASEEDALHYQRCDKHGADNGEDDHRRGRFLLSCRLVVKYIGLDGFLHV